MKVLNDNNYRLKPTASPPRQDQPEAPVDRVSLSGGEFLTPSLIRGCAIVAAATPGLGGVVNALPALIGMERGTLTKKTALLSLVGVSANLAANYAWTSHPGLAVLGLAISAATMVNNI